MSDLNSLFQTIKQRDPNQAPFHQAVEEVFMSLQPFLAKNPQYTKTSEKSGQESKNPAFSGKMVHL